jgi:N-acetyl-anhydromuramyl-L-alanine amidase AmpD
MTNPTPSDKGSNPNNQPTPTGDDTQDTDNQAAASGVSGGGGNFSFGSSGGATATAYATATATKPDISRIIWKGSPNHWVGRDNETVVAIVDHIMQGTMESTNGWFKNRRSEVSSHFGVAKDGRIWQWVRTPDAAWGNGIPESPDMSLDWLADGLKKMVNPNNLTVSIEHEGNSGDTFTEEQFQSTLWLHKYLITTYNIQPDRKHIIGHYQISARSRANCPGKGFPWQRLMNELSGMPSPVPIPMPVNTPIPSNTNPVNSLVDMKWIQGVSGVIITDLGTRTVNTNNAYVRTKPSLSGTDGSLLRVLPKGKVLRFNGYTESGPAFRDSSRWLLISDLDSGGWIHASMVS